MAVFRSVAAFILDVKAPSLDVRVPILDVRAPILRVEAVVRAVRGTIPGATAGVRRVKASMFRRKGLVGTIAAVMFWARA